MRDMRLCHHRRRMSLAPHLGKLCIYGRRLAEEVLQVCVSARSGPLRKPLDLIGHVAFHKRVSVGCRSLSAMP